MKIKLKGGKNFRDLGGIRTSDGSTVKPGLFLRGAHLSNLEDRDITYLKENFDIAAVIDLRTSEERGELPDRELPGAENVHVPVLSARTAGLSHENKGTTLKSISKARHGKKELEKIIPDLAVIYPRMMWPEAGEKFRETLDIVMKNATQSRATLYHCTVGKDRTGIVSLLILTMLAIGDYYWCTATVRVCCDPAKLEKNDTNFKSWEYKHTSGDPIVMSYMGLRDDIYNDVMNIDPSVLATMNENPFTGNEEIVYEFFRSKGLNHFFEFFTQTF